MLEDAYAQTHEYFCTCSSSSSSPAHLYLCQELGRRNSCRWSLRVKESKWPICIPVIHVEGQTNTIFIHRISDTYLIVSCEFDRFRFDTVEVVEYHFKMTLILFSVHESKRHNNFVLIILSLIWKSSYADVKRKCVELFFCRVFIKTVRFLINIKASL